MIDWSKAPHWATCAAMDRNERWYWYSKPPTIGKRDFWDFSELPLGRMGIIEPKPEPVDRWKESLEFRP